MFFTTTETSIKEKIFKTLLLLMQCGCTYISHPFLTPTSSVLIITGFEMTHPDLVQTCHYSNSYTVMSTTGDISTISVF